MAARMSRDNNFSVMVPVLGQILDWRMNETRDLLERHGLTLQVWDEAQTDRVQIGAVPPQIPPLEAGTAELSEHVLSPVSDCSVKKRCISV